MSSRDDAVVWSKVGHDLLHSFVAVVVETFLIGIYSVLVFKTGILLLGQNRTRVSLLTSGAVFAMFGLALSLWIIDIHNVVVEVQMMLLSNFAYPLEDVYSATVQRVLHLASVENVLYAYMTIVGDSVIIWRVYAFWSKGRERLVLLIPLAFLLGSIASSMVLTYCSARLGAASVLGTYQHPAFCRNIQTASYSTTLATSAVATILIAYKTWDYRHMHLEAFGKSSPRTRTQKIMIFLVESGVIYALFFLVQVIMSLSSVNASIEKSATLTFAFTIYQFITSLIVGMYPTVVVILVNSKRSVLDTITAASHVGSDHSGTLYKNTHGRSHSAYMHTTSSVTSVRTRAAPTTVDLYEMARTKSTATSGDDSDDKTVPARGPQPAVTYDV